MTGVKKLTRLASGSRTSSDRLPHGSVVGLVDEITDGVAHRLPEPRVLGVHVGDDERTVRRYVTHPVDLDIPVRSLRGRYGGYRLAPGYRMPPLMLTDDEGLAVLLGLLAARRSGTAATSAVAVESAAAKLRREGRRSERTVQPYGIVAHAARWYVTGADSASGEVRLFRLDRVTAPTVLAGTFDVPAGFDPAARVLSALAGMPYRHDVAVRVHGTVDEVRALFPPAVATVHDTPGDAWARIRIRAERLDWIPSLLAGLGRPFVVEQPEELRVLVRGLARRLLKAAG